MPTTGTLSIVAPDEARLFLDGREVGTGSWRGSAVPAGRHVVAAQLSVPQGCDVGRAQRTVTVVAGESIPVRLEPRSCGQLELNVIVNERPLTPDRAATYRVTGDRVDRSGPLPLAAPLVLPEGTYQVHVETPRCTNFDATVAIRAGAVERPRIAPFCS